MIFRVTAILLIFFFYTFSAFAQGGLIQDGIKLFEAEKYEEALEIFEKLIETQPNNEEANLFLGMTYSKLDLLEEALETFKKVKKIDPENSEVLLNLGITYYSFSEYELALENLQEALKIDPENASAQLFTGLCDLALGKNEEAIQFFEKSQKINPEFEQLSLFNQGLAHFKNKSLEKAEALFEEAIKSNPDSEMVIDAKEFLDIVKKEERNVKRLKLNANATYIADDNVILEEQDGIANEEDIAFSYNVGGSYRLFSIKAVKFNAGYNYSQLTYRKVHQFDNQSHTGFVSFSYDDEDWDMGFTYGYNYSFLDRQDFLSSNSFSPRFGISFFSDHYTSFSYTHTRKNFLNGSNDRDAIYNSIGISQFLFFMESKAFLRLGYGFAIENTQNPIFDYVSHTASMGLKLPLFAKVSANFSYFYNYQDYKSVTPSIGEQRFDSSHNVSLNVNVPVVDYLDLNINLSRTMSNSNLQSIDFVQNVSTVNLNYRF